MTSYRNYAKSKMVAPSQPWCSELTVLVQDASHCCAPGAPGSLCQPGAEIHRRGCSGIKQVSAGSLACCSTAAQALERAVIGNSVVCLRWYLRLNIDV